MRAVALVLMSVLVGCSSGAVTGKVVVGDGTPAKLGIYAAIWSVDSELSDPKNPRSTLIPKTNGASPTFMGTAAVGTSTGKAGTFQFAFHTLDRGLYFVGAYLASPNDPSPSIYELIHTVDTASLLEIDPESKDKKEVSHDVYLGISAPGTGTIRGVVHSSARAANNALHVFAANGSLLDSSASVFDQLKLGAEADQPFALFNVPLGKTWLFVDSEVGNDGDINNDFLGFPSPNPIDLDGTHTEKDGVEIWLDRQSPDLGSISGTIEVNAPVSNATVELVLEAESLGSGKVVGLISVPVTGTSATFTIPSVPFGSFYLSSAIAVDLGSGRMTGGGYYPGPPNAPAAIAVSSGTTNVGEVKMPVGVGQILGTVKLKNIPSTYKAVWVMVSVDLPNPSPGTDPPQLIMAETRVPVNGSTLASDFQLFGFPDATYNVFLVPTTALNMDPIDALNSAPASKKLGNPPTLSVEGGNRVSTVFDIDFSTH